MLGGVRGAVGPDVTPDRRPADGIALPFPRRSHRRVIPVGVTNAVTNARPRIARPPEATRAREPSAAGSIWLRPIGRSQMGRSAHRSGSSGPLDDADRVARLKSTKPRPKGATWGADRSVGGISKREGGG